MSDELPAEAEFGARAPTTGSGEDERIPLDGDAQQAPRPGVALSVLWWVEGEPERG